MTSQPQTLVTEDMQRQRDKWSPDRYSPPVSLSDIRKWAIAVYWPEKPPRLYWDEDYAKKTRFGGIVAPADFNPFAWPVEPEIPTTNATVEGGGAGTRGMNGGQTEWYHAPIRPGDILRATTALIDWNERTTRLGLTLFSTTEERWYNQHNELVKVRHSVDIRY